MQRSVNNLSNTRINKFVFVLIAIFSLSSWIDIYGVFSELPLMIPSLPEGWKLALYVSIAIEIPIIGPVVVYILNLLKPEVVHYEIATGMVIFIAFTSLSLMAKFWNYTVLLGSKRYSIPLIVLVTCLGLVDNCSSIIFFPYMKRYPQIYLLALLAGESLTGFIPVILKMIQGGAVPYCELDGEVVDPLTFFNNQTGYNHSVLNELYSKPRFSVGIYFGILSFVMCLCLLAFMTMELVPSFKCVQVMNSEEKSPHVNELRTIGIEPVESKPTFNIQMVIFCELMGLLSILAFIAWGLLSTLYTYSILPYGFKSANYAVIIANSIRFSAVILAYKRPTHNLILLNFCMLLIASMAIYLIFCAVYSPCPPLIDTTLGKLLAISCLILIDYISTYIRACIIRFISFTKGNGLITGAMVMKVSVLGGVVTGIVLVEHFKLFKARLFCLPLQMQCLGYRTRFLGT